MLPSTGLFKSFICPYFESGSSSNGIKLTNTTTGEAETCRRPFCHFKHVRKDEPEPAPEPVPVYKPAPKLLPLPGIRMLAPKQKTKLEYQPEKPEFDASPSKGKQGSATNAPLYVPAPKNGNIDTESQLDLADSQNETIELSTVVKMEALESNEDTNSSTKSSKDLANEQTKANEDVNSSQPSSSTSKHKSSSKSRDRSHSRESKSDREKNKKRDKERDRDRENERHKYRDREKDKSDKEKSHSSSSRHKSSSSSSKSSKSEKHREKSSTESRHKSSSSRSSSSSKKEHSSKTSSRSEHKGSKSLTSSSDKVKTSTSETATNTSIKNVNDVFTIDTQKTDMPMTMPEFTEEDIMRECEMIFDEVDQQFAAMHKESKSVPEKETSLKRKPSLDVDAYAEAAAAAIQKKRVAHENAPKARTQTPQEPCKPNHIKNAMQAIFNRRSELRRKQEEDAEKAAVELRAAEEKVREANEALRVAKEKALTPLIPKCALMPPTKLSTRTIAPVANMIALERAKRKVEELKAEKKPAFTPAQIRKGATRVAHQPSTALDKSSTAQQTKPPVLESNNTKISFNIRMQYYEMMVKHCLNIYPNVADAWERAQTEELTVFKKVYTPLIYKNSCMLAISKLRKEATDAGNKPKHVNKIESHEVILAGKRAQLSSWSVEKKAKPDDNTNCEPFDALPGDKAFEMIYDLRLSDEQLLANGFPRPGKRLGTAIIQNTRPNRRPNETERYCSRCGKAFQLSMYDQPAADECNYHPKSTGYRRGYADNLHRCCQQPAGTPGCTYANYHVSDYYDPNKLTCFVSTIDKPDDYVPTKKDIFALDCEMCYTTHGIELTRITVVDINGRVVYDALVKPENKIVDYNTVYSGITEQMLANETRTLRDVQAVLMSMFHTKTVLVGHSLESDLKALKLIHDVIVDTSVLFPHKMGPPKKRALKTLCIENLKRIIQENEGGHDSAEDAEVCIQLIKFYLRNKIN